MLPKAESLRVAPALEKEKARAEPSTRARFAYAVASIQRWSFSSALRR
jgi:hypothetical protein